jgi:hypothetical protein
LVLPGDETLILDPWTDGKPAYPKDFAINRCDNSRSLRLSGCRLDNLKVRQIKLAHLENVAAREAAPNRAIKV